MIFLGLRNNREKTRILDANREITEIHRLQRENKKLRAALELEGIDADTEVLEKKQEDLLTGKELEFAAKNKLKVRYICKMYSADDRFKYNSRDKIKELV